MRKIFWINPIIFAAILLLVACKKEQTSDPKEYKPNDWPVVKTLKATGIDSISVKLIGSVNGHGLSTTVTFEYGTTTNYGNVVTAIQSPLTEDSVTNMCADISGLTPCTIYHFRLKAENSIGIVYSSDMAFTNDHSKLPEVETLASTYMGKDSVLTPGGSYEIFNKWILNGTVDANGFETIVTFMVGCKQPLQRKTSEQSPIGGHGHTHVSVVINDRYLNTWCHSFYLEVTNACGTAKSNYGTYDIP